MHFHEEFQSRRKLLLPRIPFIEFNGKFHYYNLEKRLKTLRLDSTNIDFMFPRYESITFTNACAWYKQPQNDYKTWSNISSKRVYLNKFFSLVRKKGKCKCFALSVSFDSEMEKYTPHNESRPNQITSNNFPHEN